MLYFIHFLTTIYFITGNLLILMFLKIMNDKQNYYEITPLNEVDIYHKINVSYNTINIFIHICNNHMDMELIEITIPNDYTITNVIEYVETFYIGIFDSINSINIEEGLQFEEQVTIKNQCIIDIQINNNITEDRFLIEGNIFTQVFNIKNIKELIKDKINKCTDKEMYQSLKTSNIYQLNTCDICKNTFENKDLIRRLKCKHFFHIQCIDNWLINYNTNCPICKQNILPS